MVRKNNKLKFKTLKMQTPDKFKDMRVEKETRIDHPIKIGACTSF